MVSFGLRGLGVKLYWMCRGYVEFRDISCQ